MNKLNMESNKKSSPAKKPKPIQKPPVSNKKKNPNNPNPKASQSSTKNVSNSTKSSESNPTAKASQSSNKNDANSKQSAEKPTSRQHSEHNDRRYQRPEKPYHRHSNQRDQRRDNRNHYNSNYDSDRNFNRRPYQNWNSSSNPNNFSNRVWQRNYNSNHSYNRYGNSNYPNFNNFQRDGGGGNNNYPNHQSRQQSDSFRNFQSPNVESVQNNIGNFLDNSENQNFCEDNSAGDIPVQESNPPDTEPTTIQNQEIAFNQLDESLPNQVDENQQLNNDTFPLEQLTEQNQEQVSFTIEEINEDFQPIQQIHENIQEELSTNQNIPSEQFEQLNQYNSPNQSTNDLLANIKTELPEPEFNLDNCLNSNNPSPLISVIPISRLIKSEIQDLNRNDIIAPNTPTGSRRSLRPNLVQRKKSISKDGSLSENLVQRVANMDKVGIKNVINSSGTKYDAALKIQARKKLREEIRKQLKSMNFTPPEDNENNVLIPDEIVDSMSIPAVVLDEIRKAFGIVLVEDKNSKMPAEIAEKVDDNPPSKQTVEPVIQPTETTERPTKSPSPKVTPEPIIHSSERSPKSPDLMSRIKMLEECKSQSEKSPPKIKVEPSRRSRSTEPILIIDSSSSSSSSSESSSDSDTSSTSSGSNCSNSSSFKRRRRKKRILEANVVGNFEKLILPNLTPAQRRRYKEKYSKTTKNSLLYIYGVCVSRANSNKNPADEKEQLKLKQNLSSADNAQALEFLMKAILNLFEKQKETLKKNKVNKTLATQSQIKSPNLVSDMRKKSNQRYSDDDKESRRRRSESANSVELSKHQSTDKLDKKQESSKSANASKRVSFSDDGGAPVVLEIESDSETTGGENPPSRQWKSPGEKKCIEIEPNMQLSSLGTLKSPLELETALSTLGMMQSPLANYSFDIDSLKSQSKIGDEAVSSIREIDVKLMELHKRKMYIEEMILKLQKDKMEVDLWTMKLQNEKFILLNSALTCASSSSGSPKAVSVAKRNLTEVLVEEDVQGRKKRCQRDIQEIPAEATSAIKEIISKMILKPRQTKQQTRRTISSSKDEESSEEKPRPTKQTKQTRKTTNISKDEESSEETLTPSKRRSSRISKAQDKSDKISSKKQSKPQLEVQPTKVAEKEQKQKEKEKEVIEEEDEDVKTVEVPKIDYSNVPNGNLDGWKLPITQIIVIGEAIVAASEDGNIYKFNIRTRVLESKFSKHTEAITQIFTCPKENFVYTTSLDGFLKKTSIENFGLELQSLNLQEPLQSIDIEWNTAFIGSRWGNIFTYDIKNNSLSESLLCSSGSSIIAIRATKEGPRKILIVSSKGNQINFRDAMTGLLLRSLDVPDNLHIYSILLDDGCVYCGTQRSEIHQYNFTTGGRIAIFQCGNGAVSMKLYKDKYIFVGCYDGFVYVLDKTTGCQIGRFPGSGKMILALEIAGDKLITSAKDNTMQIIDIPKYIATIKDKS